MTLLASLHYVLVILALAAAGLSLVLERRVTSRLYEFFYKEDSRKERERGEYLADLLVQPRNTKEIRAYVLADYLLGRIPRGQRDCTNKREQMYQAGTRTSLFTGLVTGTALALAYLFVAVQGAAGAISPGGVVLVIGAFASVSGPWGKFRVPLSLSTSTPLSSTTTSLSCRYRRSCPCWQPVPHPCRPRR